MTSTLISDIDGRLRAGARAVLRKKTIVAAIDAGSESTKTAIVSVHGNRPVIHSLTDERGGPSAATVSLVNEKANVRVCGLSGHEVRTYLMQFPPMPKGDLEILVRRNITQNLHRDPAVALETRPGGDGKVEVMAVASSGELVSSAFERLAGRGMAVEAAYADVTALSECIRVASPDVERRPTCVFNMGATWSQLVLLDRGRLVFSRSIKTGLSDLIQTIADLCGVDVEAARELILSTGAAVSFQEANEDDLMGRTYAESVRDVIEQLVVEIHRSLSYASIRHGLPSPETILLCGGASQVPGMAAVLGRETGTSVEVFDPLDHISSGDDVDHDINGSLFCVSIGLALLAMRRGAPALRPGGAGSRPEIESRVATLIAVAAIGLMSVFISGRVLESNADRYADALGTENLVLESIGDWLAADGVGIDPELETRAYAFSLVSERPPVWQDVLMEITNAVPRGIVFDQMSFTRAELRPGEPSEWTLSATGVVTDMDDTVLLLKQMEEALDTSGLFRRVEVLPQGSTSMTYGGNILSGAIRFELGAVLE